MALNPEDIVEKSFATRFRGFDPAEVRTLLKAVASELFDLQDRISQQHGRIEEQEKELELAADDRKSFEDVIGVYKDNIDRFKKELEAARKQGSNLSAEHERLKRQTEGQQQENHNLKTDLARTSKALSEAESNVQMSRAAVDELRKTVVLLEAEKHAVKSERESQARAVDEVRRQAEELVENGNRRARQLVEEARDQIDQLRSQAVHEIARLREDIEELKARRGRVAGDLRLVLNNHLQQLDDGLKDDLQDGVASDELFQKIEFPELVEFDLHTDGDDLDGQPLTGDTGVEDDEESLENRLKDGGVAYLSEE